MKKRQNPYKIHSKEIISFRGITDESEAYNSDDAYASGMNNLESFKIRSMEQREGQVVEESLDGYGTVHNGGSFVSTKCICAGNGIFAEQKDAIYQPRAKKYPWRNIEVPLSYEHPDVPAITLRCRDIDVPADASRKEGSDNMVVSENTFLDCFVTTCSSMWGSTGDLNGYKQKDGAGDTVIDMGDSAGAMASCYEEEEEEEPPAVPPIDLPIIPTPDIPAIPVRPELPDFNWPDLNSPDSPDWPPEPDEADPIAPPEDVDDDDLCERQLLSFTPPTETEVIVTLVEGYTDPDVITMSMSADIKSNSRWTDECRIKAPSLGKRSELLVLTEEKVAGQFSCAKSGTDTIFIHIEEGLPAGTVIKGRIEAEAIDERWSIPVAIYVCKEIVDIAPAGDFVGTKLSKYLLQAGSFPTVNDILRTFHADPYDNDLVNGTSATASNSTYHFCNVGAYNISFNAGKTALNSFSQEITIPTVPEFIGGINGIFIWIEKRTKNGDSFYTEEENLSVSRTYCCGWWSASETEPKTEGIASRGTLNPSTPSSKIIEITGVFEQGSEHTLQYSLPPTTPEIPDDTIDPSSGGTITGSTNISGLKFLVMSEA